MPPLSLASQFFPGPQAVHSIRSMRARAQQVSVRWPRRGCGPPNGSPSAMRSRDTKITRGRTLCRRYRAFAVDQDRRAGMRSTTLQRFLRNCVVQHHRHQSGFARRCGWAPGSISAGWRTTASCRYKSSGGVNRNAARTGLSPRPGKAMLRIAGFALPE
jgi:hypothetical protein